MSSEQSTRAEQTTAILQGAVRSGVPVLIPGALERRDRPSPSAAAAVVAAPAAAPPSAELHDRAQLEREREGGGAPGNRAGSGHTGLLARLRRMF
jgi:hypothetical protein